MGGFLIHVGLFTAWAVGEVIRQDFLHFNPFRSRANSLMMIALSPVVGMLGALLMLPVVGVGAVLMVGVVRLRGRLPLWSLAGIAPACAMALFVEATWLLPWWDGEPIPTTSAFFLRMLPFQLPFLLGCWFLAHLAEMRARRHS